MQGDESIKPHPTLKQPWCHEMPRANLALVHYGYRTYRCPYSCYAMPWWILHPLCRCPCNTWHASTVYHRRSLTVVWLREWSRVLEDGNHQNCRLIQNLKTRALWNGHSYLLLTGNPSKQVLLVSVNMRDLQLSNKQRSVQASGSTRVYRRVMYP